MGIKKVNNNNILDINSNNINEKNIFLASNDYAQETAIVNYVFDNKKCLKK